MKTIVIIENQAVELKALVSLFEQWQKEINVITAVEDLKGLDIRCIDIKDMADFADYMIVANGRSSRQVNALADKLLDRLREKGMKSIRVEGLAQGDWVVIDAGDVVVHLFRPEVRDFYNIEKIWGVEHGAADQVMYLSA